MARRLVSIKGIDPLDIVLKNNAKMTDVKNVVKMNISELQQKLMRDAPVDTGFLKRSIVFTVASYGLTGKVLIQAEYAPYLIFGTRFMAKQDFFRPNFKLQSKQFKKDLNRLIK